MTLDAMAGMTKSPQLRLSPETAKVHVGSAACARANEETSKSEAMVASAERGRERRGVTMLQHSADRGRGGKFPFRAGQISGFSSSSDFFHGVIRVTEAGGRGRIALK